MYIHTDRGATVPGVKNEWLEQRLQSRRDDVHWNDSFRQNFFVFLEDLGKQLIWKSPNLTPPPPMMVHDGEERWSGPTFLDKKFFKVLSLKNVSYHRSDVQ